MSLLTAAGRERTVCLARWRRIRMKWVVEVLVIRWSAGCQLPQSSKAGRSGGGCTSSVCRRHQSAGLPVTGEPPARGGVRHVYLPALRDAERELASAGGDRVRMILRGLLGDDEQVDAFVERIGTEL